ncbi:MAG: transcription-repair coupling factor, partial [Lachnospiraceae bacterium]|nr:transcription-repair coupling factor [Lachnospiraceae bacterium]
MKALIEPLNELAEYSEAADSLKKSRTPIHITGCVDTQKCQLIQALGSGARYKVIITYSEAKARELYDDMRLYSHDVYIYPAKDVIFYSADVHGYAIVQERMRVMKQLLEGNACTIITTLGSGMERCVPLSNYKEHTLSFKVDEDIELNNLRKELTALGYEHTAQVETPGSFAIRGGIADIYPLTEEVPYRIELWGDTINSIHSFDVESQRSIDSVDEIELYSATEVIIEEGRVISALSSIEADIKKYAGRFEQENNYEQAGRLRQSFELLKENIDYYKGMAGLESYMCYFYDDTCSFFEYFPKNETMYYVDEPNRTYEHGEAIEYEFSESMKSRLEKGYI